MLLSVSGLVMQRKLIGHRVYHSDDSHVVQVIDAFIHFVLGFGECFIPKDIRMVLKHFYWIHETVRSNVLARNYRQYRVASDLSNCYIRHQWATETGCGDLEVGMFEDITGVYTFGFIVGAWTDALSQIEFDVEEEQHVDGIIMFYNQIQEYSLKVDKDSVSMYLFECHSSDYTGPRKKYGPIMLKYPFQQEDRIMVEMNLNEKEMKVAIIQSRDGQRFVYEGRMDLHIWWRTKDGCPNRDYHFKMQINSEYGGQLMFNTVFVH